MPAAPELCRFAAERVHLPPMAAGPTFHWDGIGTVARSIGPHIGSEPDTLDVPVAACGMPASVQAQRQTATGRQANPALMAGHRCPLASSPPQALDWAREAEGMTFALALGLLLTTAGDVTLGATGELVWARRGGPAQPITLYTHPMLLVHAPHESLQVDCVELVPHLPAGDPLLHHITLVLQAEIDAEGVAGRLYAESLTNALAVHLLRRYGTCRPPAGACPSELSKPKLRRTTAYIEAHLARPLSVTELAAVAHTSPAYFVRLFKQATGQTPHQYVIMCRIERAKQLLTETEWPIIEIGRHVGFTDQSYFTAVFRKHVTTTPNAYRGDTQR
jgi:AraC family transcriptional regulator